MGNTSAAVRNRWNAKNYFRINVTVPKGNRELIQAFAKSQNTSVNDLINQLLRRELGQTSSEWGFASDRDKDEIEGRRAAG